MALINVAELIKFIVILTRETTKFTIFCSTVISPFSNLAIQINTKSLPVSLYFEIVGLIETL